MGDEHRDIFVCHASEDKAGIVKPMVEALTQAGISCWYDEAEIKWGDSITQRVNEGLKISRYVIVVFSQAFAVKNWPQRELNAALNVEASSGQVKVLPLVVGSKSEVSAILDNYPLLNDKHYLSWDGDVRKIVEELLVRLERRRESGGEGRPNEPIHGIGLRIPLPEIKKRFTQLDRDTFVRQSFGVVKRYFQNALPQLGCHYQEVQTDFAEAHNFKFLCTIYIQGEVARQCKIWIDGYTASDSITYQSGKFSIDSDNSFNDMLNVADDEHSLGFEVSNMWFGANQSTEEGLLSAEQAAEYLWRRFTDQLG